MFSIRFSDRMLKQKMGLNRRQKLHSTICRWIALFGELVMWLGSAWASIPPPPPTHCQLDHEQANTLAKWKNPANRKKDQAEAYTGNMQSVKDQKCDLRCWFYQTCEVEKAVKNEYKAPYETCNQWWLLLYSFYPNALWSLVRFLKKSLCWILVLGREEG